MQINHLISNVLRGQWFIEPGFAEAQGFFLANTLNNNLRVDDQEPDEFSAYAVEASTVTGIRYSYWSGFDRAPHGSVAIIRINGSMMKYNQACGPMGTERIGDIIKEADSHPNISGIVLQIDSPGGTVDGTEALGNIIKATEKPVVTFVDGMMCSAAMWVGSCADYIVASTDTDTVGSVGVLLSFADVQPYWESMGIKFHTLKASTSPEKVKMWEDLREGKYDQYVKDVLDPLDEKFMSVIRENLPNVEDKHLTGATFMARDVMDVFVHEIGTISTAILKAKELAEESKTSETDGNTAEDKTNKVSFNMKYPKLTAALIAASIIAQGNEMELENDGRRTFTDEEMQALENALAENNSEELAQQLSQANETISERDTTITEMQEQIDNLMDGDGAGDNKPNQTTDGGSSTDSPQVLGDDDVEMFNAFKQ